MKKVKLIFCLCISIVLTFSLVACTQAETPATTTPGATTSAAASISPTAETSVAASPSAVSSANTSAQPTSENSKVLASTQAKGTKTDADKVKVGILLSSSSHQTFIDMMKHAKSLEGTLNCQIDELYFEQDTNRLVRGIEDFTNANEDIIIFQNTDPEATRAAVAAANDAGIITVAWDVDMDISDFAYIGLNYDIGYAIGKQAADFINSRLGGKAKVALYEIQTIPFFVERGKGMTDALAELAPNATIVGTSYALDVATAYSDAENFLVMDPGINVVVGEVDDFLAQAYKAFEANGRGKGDDLCGFFGCDCTTDGMNCMTAANPNLWFGSIFMDLNTLTEKMVTTAVNARRGTMPESRIDYYKTIPIDINNYKDYPIGQ